MKNVLKKVVLLFLVAAVACTVFVACDGNSNENSAPSTIVSGNPVASQTPSEDENSGDDVEGISGVYIVYDLGDCKDAYIPSSRQAVTDGQTYTLYTPHVPVLSNYEFVCWKNVVTGDAVNTTGVFSGTVSMYLVAVWRVYGPAV